MTDTIRTRTLTALTKARACVDAGWTQNAYGRTEEGKGTGYADPAAVAYCMVGALYHAMPNEESYGIVTPALDALIAVAGTQQLIRFNDHPKRTKEEVLAVYDRAIEAMVESA
jgi:hypothetical protein